MRKERAKPDALQESMRMLGRKGYSRHGMQEALVRKGYQRDEILAAIERLAEWGYLTDERFGEECIIHYRDAGKGRVFIEHYLVEEKLPREKVRELLDRFYPEAEEIRVAQALSASRFQQEVSPKERIRWFKRLFASGFSRKAIEACGYRDEET
jgi:SOS response regulatory protein OraA/RecX